MTESEKKDKILAFLNLEENRNAFFQSDILSVLMFPHNFVSYEEMRYLIGCIIDDGYLFGKASSFKYNSKLTCFLESGGYTGQEALEKLEAEETKKRQEMTDQKTQYELKLAKWQVIAFWVVFPLTIVGSILGVISFFMQLGK